MVDKDKLTPQEREHLIVHFKEILKEKKNKIGLKEKMIMNILIVENKISKLLF